MTLNAEGKLIVYLQKMMSDGYGDLGKMMGLILARYVEKTWVRFQSMMKNRKSTVISFAGLAIMILLKKSVSPMMIQWLGSHWGKLTFSVLYVFYCIAFIPIILK